MNWLQRSIILILTKTKYFGISNLKSLQSQCAVRAVPLAPAWPERKVNLSAASTASDVQKEKSAIKRLNKMYQLSRGVFGPIANVITVVPKSMEFLPILNPWASP
ncbi:unnamed protein product [Arctogadus glacialis]